MQVTLRLWRWLRLGALGITLCAALPPRAEAGGTPAPIGYRIERGTLATALQHWARQSGQLLVFDAGELAGLQTAGLHTRQAPASN